VSVITEINSVCSVDEAYGALFDRSNFRVSVHYNGRVDYAVAGKTTTTCLIDITYFPLDSQACYIEINRLRIILTSRHKCPAVGPLWQAALRIFFTDYKLSLKQSIFADKMYLTICVEWAVVRKQLCTLCFVPSDLDLWPFDLRSWSSWSHLELHHSL